MDIVQRRNLRLGVKAIKTTIEKAKDILDGIEIGYFDTGKNWDPDNFADYYRYFSHPDSEIRKYSLLVFAAALGNWWMKSAFVFLPLEELSRESSSPESQGKVYLFEDYAKAFLRDREAIQQEFPFLYKAILVNLIQLDNENRFENTFPSSDNHLFFELRKTLKNSEIDENYQYSFNDLLREVGLPTFFKF